MATALATEWVLVLFGADVVSGLRRALEIPEKTNKQAPLHLTMHKDLVRR